MNIDNLTGKTYIWWHDINKVKGIKEIYVTQKKIKNIFKIKYLSQQYYEEKAKEFYSIEARSHDYERNLQ